MYSSQMILTLLAAVSTLVTAKISLPKLPYDVKDLQPHISRDTLSTHHGKHHNKYVTTTASMIAKTKYAKMSLKDIVINSFKEDPTLFNNAAQSWNHDFYWKCMSPKGGGRPPKGLLDKIVEDFGSYENFEKLFKEAGNTAFGSGWAWLVLKENKLVVAKTIGAENPMTTPGSIPILCMDVWEHAYYLDYKNMRTTYVDVFMERLVNWDFADLNFEQAMREPTKQEL